MFGNFIPGPTEVHDDVLAAMAHRQIGHRSSEMHDLVRGFMPDLKRLFGTGGHVFLGTCSATGALEATVRNVVRRRLLNLECGAWGRRWGDIAVANGLAVDRQQVPWGEVNDPADVRRALLTGRYDAVTVVWVDTSTGVLNPLAEIAAVVAEFDDVLLLVDGVSVLGAMEVEVDRLGIDVLVAGVQKALAMPPGLAVFSVSAAALRRAATIENRGFYMDFLRHLEKAAADETPSTPSTAHLFALGAALERIFAEGMPARAARHLEMARCCRDWARRDFGVLAAEQHAAPTVTCVTNPKGIDLAAFLERVRAEGFLLGHGYGEPGGQTFRIGHLGEHTVAEVATLIEALDRCL